MLDLLIKNAGMPFLNQVAGKECATELELLARGKPDGNRDVKERALGRLQDWATAFMGKEELRSSELVKAYERMRSEGLPFPPRDPTATAAMVDSLSVSDRYSLGSTHSLTPVYRHPNGPTPPIAPAAEPTSPPSTASTTAGTAATSSTKLARLRARRYRTMASRSPSAYVMGASRSSRRGREHLGGAGARRWEG